MDDDGQDQGGGAACFEGAIEALKAQLRTTTGRDGAAAALLGAASMVEHAAYELARDDARRHVTRLMLMAADLERTAQDVGAG